MEIAIWFWTVVCVLRGSDAFSAQGGGAVMMTIAKIKRASLEAGSHFFESGTMRFFSSRVLDRVHYGADGVFFFVTSEQFKPSSGPAYARRYTVRKWSEVEPDSVDTVGEFQQYGSGRAANKAAAELADASRMAVQS